MGVQFPYRKCRLPLCQERIRTAMLLGNTRNPSRPVQVQCLMVCGKLVLLRQNDPFRMRLDPILFPMGKEIRRQPIGIDLNILRFLIRMFDHLLHQDELERIIGLQQHWNKSNYVILYDCKFITMEHSKVNEGEHPPPVEEDKEKEEEKKEEVQGKEEEKVVENKPQHEEQKVKDENKEEAIETKEENHHVESPHKIQEKPAAPVVEKPVQEDLGEYIKHFKTKGFHQIQEQCKKITDLVVLANKQAESLQINLGLGENKGKTVIKYGLGITSKPQSNFGITLEIRLKKKTQLHALLDNEIKRGQKTEGYHPYKLFQVTFSETDKSLKVHITSPLFEEHILKDAIHSITKACEQEEKPVLKVSGELTIKNSIRNDEVSLQKRQLVKWISQGLSGSLQVTGSQGVISNFISPLTEIFPIFKVVRSGEISLKLRSPGNVDKLFDKLGISEASEQTPTLSAFLSHSLKQHLNPSSLPCLADLARLSLNFCSSLPSERLHLQLSLNLAHLRLDLSLIADACKQLADLTSHSEIFT